MRTTLDIDDDVLDSAKMLAVQRKQSVGKVISEVFRGNFATDGNGPVRNGLRVIQRGPNAKIVTMEMINKLRDEIGE